MAILNEYRSYESKVAVNFVPKFPSVVSRISVNKEAISVKTGCEIIVMYIDGNFTKHCFNEFESVLQMVKDQPVIQKVLNYEIS